MIKRLFIFCVFFVPAYSLFAMTPTLSLSNTGSSDSVLLSVTADPNSSVVLSYYSTIATGVQTHTLGTTDVNGKFWQVIGTLAHNISSNGPVSVTVNGSKSVDATWPYVSNGQNSQASNSLSLSQTGLVLGVGETKTLSALNATSLYLFNNTNPAIVNVSISNSQITVTANSSGTTIFTICASASNCASVYVTVQSGTATLLNFSQSNPTIAVGSPVSISIFGGTSLYTLSNNSNENAIKASISGQTLTLTANSGSGQSALTICTTDGTSCGIVNVTIGQTTSNSLSVSKQNVTLSSGQTDTVTLSGGNGSYTIKSNSNANSVQATISGSSLSVYGMNYGTATVIICDQNSNCVSTTVAVGTGGGGGSITLSQSNLVLVAGQTASVTISGGTAPYDVSSNATTILKTSLSNNIITITGLYSGVGSVSVCSAQGGCVALTVTVNASNGAGQIGNSPGFSQQTASLSVNQNVSITLSGSGGYYVATNTNQSVVTATVAGSALVVTGLALGNANITVCQSTGQCNILPVSVGGQTSQVNTNTSATPTLNPSLAVGQTLQFNLTGSASYYLSSPVSNAYIATLSGSLLTLKAIANGSGQVSVCASSGACSTFAVTVTGGSDAQIVVSTPSAVTQTTQKYVFSKALDYGDKDDEVVELQKRLAKEGYFKGVYSKRYGEGTVTAMKKFQKAHGLEQLGNLGPASRNILNK
jgi:hypothetical protein